MGNAAAISESKVKDIFFKNDTAKTVIENIAGRIRDRTFLELGDLRGELLRSGKKINDEDFNAIWHSMQAAGLGSLIAGRNGKKTRFEFGYSLKHLAMVAMHGQEETLAQLRLENEKRAAGRRERMKQQVKTKEEKTPPTKDPISNGVRVIIPLSSNKKGCRIADIKLPGEITKEDLELIITTLRAV